jgi:hypothetical protein
MIRNCAELGGCRFQQQRSKCASSRAESKRALLFFVHTFILCPPFILFTVSYLAYWCLGGRGGGGELQPPPTFTHSPASMGLVDRHLPGLLAWGGGVEYSSHIFCAECHTGPLARERVVWLWGRSYSPPPQIRAL